MSAGSRTGSGRRISAGRSSFELAQAIMGAVPGADRFTGVADLSVIADSGQRSQRFQSKTSPIVCAVAARLSHVSRLLEVFTALYALTYRVRTSIPRARSTVRTPTASPAPGSTLQHQLQRSPERETAPLRSG